jgi:cell division protein FtsI (penicillin-binding protein 3)
MHPQVNNNKKIIAENFSDNYKGYHSDMSIVGTVMALKNIAADDDAEWTAVKKQESRTVATSIKYAENFIPDVTGMGLRDALYLLESKGLKVKVVGKGMVEKQSLPAGNTIEKGQEIIIELS